MTTLWIRRALLGLLGLFLLAAAGVAWWVASFDANRYKGLAVDWMQRERHRTLVIDGPIELSVLPRLQLHLSKISLSEHNSTEPFAAVEDASLAVQLWPLLKSQVVVDRVTAKGVRLTLKRDAKGDRNIDDLLKSDSSAASDKQSLNFDVSRIQLEDARLNIDDPVAGLRGEVGVVSLTTGRLKPGLETPVSLNLNFALQQPALVGDLVGDTRLTLDAGNAGLTLAGTKLNYKGTAPGLAALDLGLRGDLAYEAAGGAVRAKDLALDVGATAGTLVLAGSKLTLDSLSYDPAARALALAKLHLVVVGTQAREPVGLDLDWPQLDVKGDALTGSAVGGSLHWGADRGDGLGLTGSFASGPPTGTFDLVKLPGLAITLKGHSGANAFDGKLGANAALRPAKSSLALDALDLQAQVHPAQGTPLTLAVRGSASGSRESAGWNLAGTLGSNAFSSDGTVKLGGAVPNVQAQAKFDSLDVDSLVAPSTAPAPPAAGDADTPVDLSALRKLDGRFSLRAGTLVKRPYRIADARLDATLDGGLLRVTTLLGKTWGGNIDASGSADAKAQRVALKLAATGVDVHALLNDVAKFDRLAGTGRVTADVQSTGASVKALRGALRGTAAMQLRDGSVTGMNLAKTLRQAKAAISLRQDAVQQASQTEKTDFSELSASFQIADGIARSTDLDAKSPFLRLGGAGAIDIGRGSIDYTVRATVASTMKGQDGADLALLKGLTVPVKLSGPFTAVDWNVQWSAVAAGALTNQLRDKLGDALGDKLGLKPAPGAASGAASGVAPSTKPKDLLKDKLRGLIR